jgi:hypothetical protein
MFSPMPRSLYARRKSLRYKIYQRMVGTHSESFGVLAGTRIDSQILSCPAHSPITIPTTCLFLIYPVTWYDYGIWYYVLTSLVFRRKKTSLGVYALIFSSVFCPFRICTSFARFRLFVFLYFIFQLSVPLFCHFLTTVSYNICTISHFTCPFPRSSSFHTRKYRSKTNCNQTLYPQF